MPLNAPLIARATRRLLLLVGIHLLPVLHAVEPAGPQTARVYLSGTDKDHTVPWDFRLSAGRGASGWTTIPVPSCWETKGFGTYRYGSWGPEDEYGQYRRPFDVPADWKGRRIFLVFEGSMTETEIWVNGLPAGAGSATDKNLHRGGFYEFTLEITGQVKFGAANLLEVTVRKVSGDKLLNDAERKGDYWNFGGIFRPVYLEARPSAHIKRMAVDARADGTLTVDAFLSGLPAAAKIVGRVTTLQGDPVGPEFSVPAPAGAASAHLTASIPGVQPWSPEFPNLYRLTLELRAADTTPIIHSLTQTIGFRTVSFVKGEGFYLNGKRIRLKGTVIHEFWPTTGRTSSRDQHIADIELAKAMGMNTLRRAHYPASREFYEEADRLGLLVLDELGGWQHAYSDQAAKILCPELVIRDVNHPCVIAWDNGNEGGWNTKVDGDFDLYDPQQRIVIHPATWDHAFNGLKTHHYSDYAKITGYYLGAGKTAFMPTENLHGLYDGGAGAGLYDYWEAIRHAPNGAGLFIWGFLDEGLVRDDQGGKIDVVGDAAPDGIVGPYREKEASFYTIRKLWCPVQITPHFAGDAATLTLENRFVFTDLSQCALRWQLGDFPDPAAPAATLAAGFAPATGSGSLAGPKIPPGATGTFSLPLPSGWQAHDALRLTATDPHGRELYTWTWPLRTEAAIRNRIVPPASARPAITAAARDGALTVTAGPRVFRFDPASGRLLGVSVAGQTVSLANGPRPVTGDWKISTVTHGPDGADYLVTVNGTATAPDAFRWRVRPDGWLHLDYRYTLTGPQPWLGITFDYPEDKVTALTWLGCGPYRVWKNRLAGQELDVHHKTANNTQTGKEWGYPEFRGYHAGLRWATFATTETPITLVTPTPDLFLRVLSWHDESTSRPGVNVARPPGDISLLHGINAIGNKFGDAASMGPQGLPNQADGTYTGSVDFFFGDLPSSSPAPSTQR